MFALLSVEQVRSMGQQTGSESRVVFLQHMRNTNSNTNVNTVNLRGFMDEVSVHVMYVFDLYEGPVSTGYLIIFTVLKTQV